MMWEQRPRLVGECWPQDSGGHGPASCTKPQDVATSHWPSGGATPNLRPTRPPPSLLCKTAACSSHHRAQRSPHTVHSQPGNRKRQPGNRKRTNPDGCPRRTHPGPVLPSGTRRGALRGGRRAPAFLSRVPSPGHRPWPVPTDRSAPVQAPLPDTRRWGEARRL